MKVKINDFVIVSDPDSTDYLYEHSFQGRVVSVGDLCADVMDGNNDVWSVSLDCIEEILSGE